MNSEKQMWEDIKRSYREKYRQDALKNYPNLVKLPQNLKKLMPVEKKIILVEKFLSKWSAITETERLIAIDDMGDIVIDALGDGRNVPLLDEEESLIKTFGIVMIHCHPLTYLEGKIDTFSPNDLMLLYKLGIPESRVVFGSEIFVWKKGKKRVNKKIVINNLEEILEQLKSNKIMSAEFQENMINKLATEYGAEYYKEKIK